MVIMTNTDKYVADNIYLSEKDLLQWQLLGIQSISGPLVLIIEIQGNMSTEDKGYALWRMYVCVHACL